MNPPSRILTADDWYKERPVDLIRPGVFRFEYYHHDPKTGLILPEPYAVYEDHNAYVNAGGVLWLNLLIGAGGTVFSAANAYIGVGDSTTANDVTQTDLQASTNKVRTGMDATFPSLSGQVMTWQATLGPGVAEWGTGLQEAALFNASSSGTMLCRSVANRGPKASMTTLKVQYRITIP